MNQHIWDLCWLPFFYHIRLLGRFTTWLEQTTTALRLLFALGWHFMPQECDFFLEIFEFKKFSFEEGIIVQGLKPPPPPPPPRKVKAGLAPGHNSVKCVKIFPRLELVRARPKISPHAKNQPWGSSSFFNQFCTYKHIYIYIYTLTVQKYLNNRNFNAL